MSNREVVNVLRIIHKLTTELTNSPMVRVSVAYHSDSDPEQVSLQVIFHDIAQEFFIDDVDWDNPHYVIDFCMNRIHELAARDNEDSD